MRVMYFENLVIVLNFAERYILELARMTTLHLGEYGDSRKLELTASNVLRHIKTIGIF